ncbi:6-hydroxymethylpterin diphosphokinase MptE-like protein [Gracilibacillus sp. YIM 98692]|uniref:motility associated factor glycosyltransferase family protein n=1 Tax=Gracilibacillus sp. YIM 98692 TaxID=2663532 RepID=UPI0013D63403|nr:6-hydroxymethylpterin diphosphokinase MptE-like protein [Gracilibacillus sp. YIM 98692]
MIIANEHETKEMFQKNVQLLSPWLRESVLQIDEKELWEKVQVTYNDEGMPLCKYHDKNTSFQITSERPVQEAKQWCDTLSLQGKGAIFMYGSGFAYSLFEIFKQKQPHTLVVLFEEDISLFTAMLYYFDLEPIIHTQKIAFLIGDVEHFTEAFEQLFFSIIFANCTSPVLAFTPIALRNFKPQYLEIHQYIFSKLGLFVFYIGNDHLDTLIGFNNLIGNMKEIVQSPYLSCLKDQYRDIPAFIVANGPSLDKNIHQLKKIQGKGLIISTESAIVPLLRNHIKPDILTIIERTKNTYTYHFENIEYPEDIALLSLALVDNQVYPAFPGEKIPIFRKNEAINNWVNKYVGDGIGIDAGANVSHLALELAVYLGANPIVFVGQDYAFGPEGLTHSKDAVYSEEKGKKAREVLKSKPVVYVEGNDGTMIPSTQLWTDFKQGLERKIFTHSYKNIINATEGGAKINGTECMRLSRVMEEYCTEPIPNRVHQLIADKKKELDITGRIQGLQAFIKNIEEYLQLFYTLRKEAIKGKQICQEMIQISEFKDHEKYYKLLEEAYKDNMQRYQLFISDELYRSFTQQIVFVYFYLLNHQGLIDTPKKIKETFQLQHDFFHHLNVVCQSVSIHLENAMESLEDIQLELRKG